MKVLKNLLPLLATFVVINFQGWSQSKCGTDYRHEQKLLNPKYQKEFEETRFKFLREKRRERSVLLVPVAIHFNGSVTSADMCCLIEASVKQIESLNKDFASLNPDISLYQTISNSCPDEFPPSSLSSGAQIQFFIATSNHPPSSGLLDGQYAITVGQEEFCDAGDEWDGYFNIFVDDDWGQGESIAGEASDIGDAMNPTGDNGVALIPSVFGAIGVSCTSGSTLNTSSTQNLGRTLTHEAGHFFGLKHIFNSIGATCVDADEIEDTPWQIYENYGSPTVNLSSCLSSAGRACNYFPLNELFTNYMDYTNDDVKVMFTVGQASLMESYGNQGNWKSGTNNYPIICLTYSSPVLTTNYVNVACPASTFDLTTLNVSTSIPCNSKIVWKNANGTTISSPIIESGIYFASYYNTTSNCYGPSQQVNVLFNCCNESDIIVNTNTLYATPRYIGGNIIVNTGNTLSIKLTNIIFNENKGIIVKNGGRLRLQGSKIAACDPSKSWAGIKIESGGFFSADESSLKNVTNGIDAQTNSTLQIYDLNIEGIDNTSGVGLKLDGNVNAGYIYNLDIKDFNIGIQSISSSKVHEFNHGSIINTSFGIHSVSSPIIVNDYDINFTNEAITLTGSAGSSIFDCDINYKQQGIAITLSPSTNVENCSVTNKDWVYGNIENPNERPAIAILLSDNCTISNNFPISSASNAVSVWGSNGAIIDNNNIATNFSLNGQLVGGPVNLQFGNGHSVINNIITADLSEFGINSSWAGNTTIMNNTVYNSGFQKNFRTAAIKATGNLGEIIHQNIVTGVQRTGILVQNTSGNDFFCNEINSTYDEAQDILYNSEQQFFKANTFDGGGYDLKIKSEIGLQATVNTSGNISENNGNLFFGGNAEADQAVVLGSQFPHNLVNANHKPANPLPAAGWFTPNTVVPFANCDGLIIGDNFIFANDPTKICAYWNHLKSIRNSKPELFFVKLVHLLKYAKTKPGFVLPNCIKFDPVFQTLCGTTKIVDISVELANLSKSSINTSYLQELQDQYKNESNDAGKAAIKDQMSQEMAFIKPQFDNERNVDSLRLDSLKDELNTINCTSIIVNKWKEILKLYINFIKQGQVQNGDKAALESYSADCSDLYGEAIHLARAMANTYNRTYYDVNDGCLESAEPRLTFPLNLDFNVSLAPNPTNGKVIITFSKEYSGTVNVFNTSGQQLLSQRVNKSSFHDLDISNGISGMYLVQVISDQGISKEFKIILVK